MIDVELACGWRISGTTARPKGVQVLDANGEVVKGVAAVDMHFDTLGTQIQVTLHAAFGATERVRAD